MRIKILDEKCMPTKGYISDAGWDLYARLEKEIVLKSLERVTIPAGIAVELKPNTYGNIKTRSSVAQKGLLIMEGVIDPNYRGEIKITLVNLNPYPVIIKPYERIAQLVVTRLDEDSTKGYKVVDVLSETERGDKGFGSSGR